MGNSACVLWGWRGVQGWGWPMCRGSFVTEPASRAGGDTPGSAPWGCHSTAQRPLTHQGGPAHLHLRRDQALHLPLAGIQHSLQLLAVLLAPGHALGWRKDAGTHPSIGSWMGFGVLGPPGTASTGTARGQGPTCCCSRSCSCWICCSSTSQSCCTSLSCSATRLWGQQGRGGGDTQLQGVQHPREPGFARTPSTDVSGSPSPALLPSHP